VEESGLSSVGRGFTSALAGIAPMVQRLRQRATQVCVNIHDHCEGSAPLTAQKLRVLLSWPLS
jgi:hypothetical protein